MKLPAPNTQYTIKGSVLKTMWAPWRIEYILGSKEEGCIFCQALSKQNELTLYKGDATMVIMNKFPYINGHLLAAPVRHVSALDQLNRKEMGQLLATVEKSVGILKEVMSPDGFNIGLNLGKVAGAGLEEHLHFHIVPLLVFVANRTAISTTHWQVRFIFTMKLSIVS